MRSSFIRTWALVGSLALVASACSDDGLSPNGNGDPSLSHGGPAFPPGTNITAPGDYTINGAKWTAVYPLGVGTGVIDPFLTIQNSGSEHGFNTDASPLPLDAKRPNFTDALPLNNVPVIIEPGFGEAREFILDGNENKSGTGPQFSIDILDVWVCQDNNAPNYSQLSHFQANAACAKVYDLTGHAALLATTANTSGSGSDLDYRILIPAANFGNDANAACQYDPTAADCGYYVVVYAHMGGVGGNWMTDATFEEFSTIRRGFITVTKTANTSLTRTTTRTWTWTIDKEIVEPEDNPALIQQNQSLDIKYKVTLDASSNDVVVDSDWSVSGNITIGNPSGDPVEIASVSDIISHAVQADINVSVSCPVTFPHTLNSGGSLVCTYTQALPDGDARTNTAFVTLADLASVSANADIDFSAATVNDVFVEMDECVNVNDVVEINNVEIPALNQNFGQYCAASGLPKVYQYTHTITPDMLECDENTVDNTATFVANDTGATDDASASQGINVACEEGCTLTQGYWKTHADPTRKKFDATWEELANGPNTQFFLSGQSWIQVFNTSPGGNQYYNLAHQYMAAVLNGFHDQNPPAEVVAALADAKALFETYTPDQVGAWKGNQGQRALFVSLAGTLASYNEGAIGPGHCTEQ